HRHGVGDARREERPNRQRGRDRREGPDAARRPRDQQGLMGGGRFRRRGAPAPARPPIVIVGPTTHAPPAVPDRPAYAPAATPPPAVALDLIRRARFAVIVLTVALVPIAFWRRTFDYFN